MFTSSLRLITRRTFSTSILLRQAEAKAAPQIQSSCAAGTPLNLKIKKSGNEPVALEDSEYPEWLWECLDKQKTDDQLKASDFLKWKKKQINKINTKKIKNNNFLSQM
ncbi:54S ribosomal protein L37, mitochondrial [[Candida] anglica]|uniref:Large ribosomal subunit protein mL54 n=1 Tax=[Candida] anglica TaxID=148631 RepID=A0ABP0EHZ2_9ASCO